MLLFSLSFLLVNVILSSSLELDVLMPNVAPTEKDTYLCYKYALDQNEPIYITEFQPMSTKEIAHHMLVYSCENVGEEEVWNCGEMHASKNSQYKQAPICAGGKQAIVYAWAMDAPKLVLPKDVAFKLGGNTDKKHLVLQVHYANVDKFLAGETDHSGVKLIGQKEPLPNTAGVYLLGTSGYVKAHKPEHFETACEITEDVTMHPFAYRTHAHKLGLVNSGYVVKSDKRSHEQTWTEIGRRSPQLPQMFFPATNKVPINKGDVLAARCTMNNYLDHTVQIGSTGDDEMCNFYIMYYVKGDKLPESNTCFSMGPPTWYFESFKSYSGKRLDTSVIPEDASSVPENQVKELADHNSQMGGMHGMNGMSHDMHMMKPEEQQTAGVDSQESAETDSDEYVAFLDQLERSSKLDSLLKNLERKNKHRF